MEKKTKNPVKIISFILCVVTLGCLFCSCSAKMKLGKGGYTCTANGCIYVNAPDTYMPKSKSTEVYAVYTYNDVKLNFYSVEGLEPEEWLVDDNGSLYYAGSETLPELSGFGAETMFICYNTDVPFTLINEKDSELIEKIIDRFENGEAVSFNYYDYSTYQLIFTSEKYEYLYYRLRLRVCAEGMFMYDRSTDRNVDVSDLFSQYDDIAYDPEDFE